MEDPTTTLEDINPYLWCCSHELFLDQYLHTNFGEMMWASDLRTLSNLQRSLLDSELKFGQRWKWPVLDLSKWNLGTLWSMVLSFGRFCPMLTTSLHARMVLMQGSMLYQNLYRYTFMHVVALSQLAWTRWLAFQHRLLYFKMLCISVTDYACLVKAKSI